MAKLPVLMYHNVSPSSQSGQGLTIAVNRLEEQFRFLRDHGYTTLHFSDLEAIQSAGEFPEKAVIITFDDVYVSQLKYAYPLLQKYNLKACFYIPFEYVGDVDLWNTSKESIMNIEQLRSLDSKIIELGLHSFSHDRYDNMLISDIQFDFEKCLAFQEEFKLNLYNTLAYPYGKYPRKGKQKDRFFNVLNDYKIAYGLRIGNRINSYPFKNNYEVQRLDIKGEDNMKTFIKTLKKGKRWF